MELLWLWPSARKLVVYLAEIGVDEFACRGGYLRFRGEGADALYLEIQNVCYMYMCN